LWLNKYGTTLSLSSLWINFMSIRAKLLCQCNCINRDPWLGLKIFQGYIIHRLWFYKNSNSVAMPLSKWLPQIVYFHELTISIRPLPTFYFQRQVGVLLALGLCLSQTHSHPYAFWMALQNLRIITPMLTTISI
jgi:hypothetical protein